MKTTNHKFTLIVLLVLSICTLSGVGITYSKFVFKQDTSKTIAVPEYTQCLSLGASTLSECILINENDFYETSSVAKTDLKTKTADFTKVPTADEGLFMSQDDSGESYYFRGNVVDNYVSYAGYIWRIIRVNGDGTVRMIYAGTSTLATGADTTIGTTKYNDSEITDMTLLGYKYGLNQSLKTSNEVIYSDLYAEKTSVHSNERSCSSSTKLCTLSGNNVITEQWSAGYKSVLHFTWTDIMSYFRKPKYTCWKPSTDSTCNITMEVTGRNDGGDSAVMPTEVLGKYYGYISNSYNDTLTNENSSTIKTTLENWYVTNIQNKLDDNSNSYASYVADSKFCNDRSLASGDGNTLNSDSVYASYNRNTNNKTPSLKCSQSQDGFSSTTAKGNGGLSYPIGLITADEIAMSGTVAGTTGTSSFLNTGISYWTMSPGYFSASKLSENMYIMNSDGTLSTSSVKVENSLRPVINLSSTVKVTKGNGTITNPYQVSLN